MDPPQTRLKSREYGWLRLHLRLLILILFLDLRNFILPEFQCKLEFLRCTSDQIKGIMCKPLWGEWLTQNFITTISEQQNCDSCCHMKCKFSPLTQMEPHLSSLTNEAATLHFSSQCYKENETTVWFPVTKELNASCCLSDTIQDGSALSLSLWAKKYPLQPMLPAISVFLNKITFTSAIVHLHLLIELPILYQR